MTLYGYTTKRNDFELEILHAKLDLFLKHEYVQDRMSVIEALIEGEINVLCCDKYVNNSNVYISIIVTSDATESTLMITKIQEMVRDPQIFNIEVTPYLGYGYEVQIASKHKMHFFIVPQSNISNLVSYRLAHYKLNSIYWLPLPTEGTRALFDRVKDENTKEYYSEYKHD